MAVNNVTYCLSGSMGFTHLFGNSNGARASSTITLPYLTGTPMTEGATVISASFHFNLLYFSYIISTWTSVPVNARFRLQHGGIYAESLWDINETWQTNNLYYAPGVASVVQSIVDNPSWWAGANADTYQPFVVYMSDAGSPYDRNRYYNDNAYLTITWEEAASSSSSSSFSAVSVSSSSSKSSSSQGSSSSSSHSSSSHSSSSSSKSSSSKSSSSLSSSSSSYSISPPAWYKPSLNLDSTSVFSFLRLWQQDVTFASYNRESINVDSTSIFDHNQLWQQNVTFASYTRSPLIKSVSKGPPRRKF